MNQSLSWFVACLFSLGLGACNFENYEDCEEDAIDLDEDFEGGHSKAGRAPTAGSSSTNGGSGSGAAPTQGGSAPGEEPSEPEPMEPPATPCELEHDCAPGFNCDLDAQQCLPADAETCGELLVEQDCIDRSDCTPVYGGTNCSCGADCECVGGEPGCVCESFQFFVCATAE